MKTFEIILLLVCAIIDIQASAFVMRSSAIRKQSRSLAPSTKIWNENLNEEAEDLQREINKLVKDPPMFSAWNDENFDENALPIPIFTAQVVTIASVAFTAWIYYLGFSAPTNPPMP
ncbi:unnamed protein product [Cylindrotheca closterium]|uniref:Transmembrane protein n=1 Tax=Cylindrotheca closterium TaxID=2856 RepID=A0AAD2CGT5_9STRA|nr:unnamed protein product [Cylindrotheca closterium]